jgi:glycosyltransferase involved in cell wall biosynthesis
MPAPVQISAVIPTYNRCHVIGRAIASVLAQTQPPAEVIIVDDGSDDSTRNICEAYGSTVRCVFQKNLGVAGARNRGVKEARCEWVAFLDSDDYWVPEHLTRMTRAIEATDGKAALYFSDLLLPQGPYGEKYWDRCAFAIAEGFEFKRDASEWALLPVQPMMLQASVIRRRTYLEIGSLPEHLRTREDTLLFFKLALLYPVCAVSGCGTVMNSDGNHRLTALYGRQSLVFWDATIRVYREVLATTAKVRRDRRPFFVDALAESYFSMGQVLWRGRKYWSASKRLALACSLKPALATRYFSRAWKRTLVGPKGESDTSGMSSRPKA